MSEKYISKVKDNYRIVKSIGGHSTLFGVFKSLEEAIFIRDILVDANWNLNGLEEVYKKEDYYFVVNVINERVHLLAKYKKKPTEKQIEKLTKKKIRNPNNSKYGLNITRVFDVYVIKKQIAGDDFIFGHYGNLEDAEFVRNFLMDNNWNVDLFNQVEKDENNQFKCIEVIDDKVCVLGTFKTKKEALDGWDGVHDEFISKIYKNKHGFARYPHLDLFADLKLGDVKDENWDLDKLDDVSAFDLIFNLTPWQKIIYDNVNDEFTFEELKSSLKRYESKNFDKKIQKHLDELIELNIVKKSDENKFKKIK